MTRRREIDVVECLRLASLRPVSRVLPALRAQTRRAGPCPVLNNEQDLVMSMHEPCGSSGPISRFGWQTPTFPQRPAQGMSAPGGEPARAWARRVALPVGSLLSAALLPALVLAQDGGEGPLALSFSIGGGIESVPSYFGSDEAEAGFALGFDVGYARVGRLSFGDPDPEAPVPEGFSFRGGFRYVPERSAADHSELAGLEDVDASFEIGGGLAYSQPWWEVFAVARYGVGGHEAVVGELGFDLIARPTERLSVRGGPRVTLGSNDYAAAYFGVTADEAAASAFPAFEAEGGVLSSGVEIGLEYALTPNWSVTALARYEQLRNDAADSPITVEDDQLSASLLVTRRFALGL